MSNSQVASTSSSSADSSKKGKGKATTKLKDDNAQNFKAKRPKVAEMVDAAIKNLKDRGGSSLSAIKKYISATYDVDTKKLAPFINKYLNSAVISEHLIRTKGKGALGFFKLATTTSHTKSTSKESKPKSKTKKPESNTASPSPINEDKKNSTGKKKVTSKAKPTSSEKKADKKTAIKNPKTTKPQAKPTAQKSTAKKQSSN